MKAQRSLEEKLQIVLAGLKGQDSIAELCRRHGLSETAFYHWQKLFLEGGKEALTNGRSKGSSRQTQLEQENEELKQLVAELELKLRVFKKLQGLR
jgi:transposase